MASRSLCDPCLSVNREKPALKWCMECQDAICTDCAESHKMYKVLKSHHVVDLEQKKSHEVIADLTSTNCAKHQGIVLEYFCVDHDQVCCRDCLPTVHKLCKNTMSLDSASKGVKQSMRLVDLNVKVSALLGTLDKLNEARSRGLEELTMESDIVKDQITRIKEALIKDITDMETKLLEKLNTVIADLTNKIKGGTADDKIKKEIATYQKNMMFAQEHASEKQTFLFVHEVDRKLPHIEQELKNVLSEFRNFKIAFKQADAVISSDKCFGTIDLTEEPCNIVYASPTQRQAQIPSVVTGNIQSFELEKKIDVRGKIITAMAVKSDNTLLLCSRCLPDKGILMYNEKFQYINRINMSGAPWDITVRPNESTAVVTFLTKDIQFVDTVNYVAGKKVTFSEHINGITSTENNIIVGGDGKMLILDQNGKHMCTLKINGGSINYIHIGTKGDYYYTDSRRLYCINPDGKQVFSYCIQGELEHRNMTTDNQGNIYLVGRDTSTVERFSPDGSFDRTILKNENGINNPLAICFNKQRDRLYVSNYDHSVSVYKCK